MEDRLKYFESGDVPKKNLDVMREATEASKDERVTLGVFVLIMYLVVLDDDFFVDGDY